MKNFMNKLMKNKTKKETNNEKEAKVSYKNNYNFIKNKKKKGLDYTTIVVLDIVLIVVAIALAISLFALNKNYSSGTETADFDFTTEEVSVNIDDTLMTEYTNQDLGIKLKYYNDYTKVSETTEVDAMYKSAAMYKEETKEGISILIGSVSENTTFDSYLNATVTAVMESNNLKKDDIVVIKNNIKLGNLDAFKIRYKMEDGTNIYQIYTIKDNKEYVVTYSAEDANYDKQKADNMFSTFEFINK